MSKSRKTTRTPSLLYRDDLTDWAAIGAIVFVSSILLWAPLLAGGWNL